jgi:hypothetical protein
MTGEDHPRLVVDLRDASFDQWLGFVFDHEPLEEGQDSGDAWYWTSEVELAVQPARQVAHLLRLFERPDVLLSRFTEPQIEQGFWFMFSAGGTDWFLTPLWDPNVPWAAREACIRAIPSLYERLFDSDEEGEGVAWMLWDFLAFGYDCGNRDPSRSEEDKRVQEAMLEAMSEMLLGSSSAMAQRAALHGLFHLQHRSGSALIQTYLDSRWTSQSLREYAELVLRGEAL